VNHFFLNKLIKFFITKFVNFLRFFFRKDIELCSSGFGKFSGHTKYFFLSNGLDGLYWVCHDKNEYHSLKLLHPNIVMKFSIKYWILLLKSNTFHITHNISDIFIIKPKGVKVINHWHGIAIKKIGYDSNVERVWIENKIKSNQLLPYDEWDVFICQSEHHVEIISQAFKMQKSKIIHSVPSSIQFLKDNYKGGQGVLYVPTFRSYQTSSNLHLKNLAKIRARFGSDIPIKVKLHPLDSICLKEVDNVNLVDKDIDVFEAMVVSDYLITDYSSVAYDFFQATGLKVYLIQDDFEEYSSFVGGLYNLDHKLSYEVI